MDLSELSEAIVAAIRARNASGESYDHMGQLCGLSHTHIHRLANRRALPSRLSLENFLALFPSARIELAPARVPDDLAADVVPKSEYQALREQYQDLRDKYQDLREKYLDIRDSRPPAQISTLSASK